MPSWDHFAPGSIPGKHLRSEPPKIPGSPGVAQVNYMDPAQKHGTTSCGVHDLKSNNVSIQRATWLQCAIGIPLGSLQGFIVREKLLKCIQVCPLFSSSETKRDGFCVDNHSHSIWLCHPIGSQGHVKWVIGRFGLLCGSPRFAAVHRHGQIFKISTVRRGSPRFTGRT